MWIFSPLTQCTACRSVNCNVNCDARLLGKITQLFFRIKDNSGSTRCVLANTDLASLCSGLLLFSCFRAFQVMPCTGGWKNLSKSWPQCPVATCAEQKTVWNGLDFNSSTKLPTFVMEKPVTNYRERGEVAWKELESEERRSQEYSLPTRTGWCNGRRAEEES